MKLLSIIACTALLFVAGLTACSREDRPSVNQQAEAKVIIIQRHIGMAYDNLIDSAAEATPALQPPPPYADHPLIETQEQYFSLIQSLSDFSGVYTLTVREQIQDYTLVELQFNDRLLYASEAHKARFGGFCQMPKTKALVFFIDSVDEGIGTYYHEILYQDEEQNWVTKVLPGLDSPSIFDVHSKCETIDHDGSNIDASDINYAHCHCILNDSAFSTAQTQQWHTAIGTTEQALFELPANFQQGHSQPLNLYPISDQASLQALIDKAEQDASFEVTRISLGTREVLTVTHRIETYFNIGYGFLWDKDRWYLWYTAGDSSKTFQPITQLTQTGVQTVSMELCCNDCGWWGERSQVELDLSTLTFKKIAADE